MKKNVEMYYDEDADLDFLKNKKVGVLGYGIIGKAMALNLRDSGVNLQVGNRKDSYSEVAKKDGFDIKDPKDVAGWADIILFLIPDDAQSQVYSSWIRPYLKENKALVFAHGYSVYFSRFEIPKYVDILLLAPRMPGKYIRERYLNGWGVPVFVDAFQDYTGNGLKTVLALAKGIGATRAGAMKIALQEETELDLFIEQYFYATITYAIHAAFDFLVAKGFTPEAAISELYASGEIGNLIKLAASSNIYKVFRDNASPTCQFGKMQNTDKVGNVSLKALMENVISDIRSGKFDQELKKAAKKGYKVLNEYNKKIDHSELVKTHQHYNKIHRRPLGRDRKV